MKLVTLGTKQVLESLKADPERQSCYAANTNKQIYQLDIVEIEPNDQRVVLKTKKGRVAPLESDLSWDLSFRDQKGAYQAPVKRMIVRDGEIVFLLENYLFFLARREKIRLAADSRSPTVVQFVNEHKESIEGSLIDFNLEGIGLQLQGDRRMDVNDQIFDGQFDLRAHKIAFDGARVAHTSYTELGQRLGLTFTELTEAQKTVIQEAFEAWIHSQKHQFPNPDEL